MPGEKEFMSTTPEEIQELTKKAEETITDQQKQMSQQKSFSAAEMEARGLKGRLEYTRWTSEAEPDREVIEGELQGRRIKLEAISKGFGNKRSATFKINNVSGTVDEVPLSEKEATELWNKYAKFATDTVAEEITAKRAMDEIHEYDAEEKRKQKLGNKLDDLL